MGWFITVDLAFKSKEECKCKRLAAVTGCILLSVRHVSPRILMIITHLCLICLSSPRNCQNSLKLFLQRRSFESLCVT